MSRSFGTLKPLSVRSASVGCTSPRKTPALAPAAEVVLADFLVDALADQVADGNALVLELERKLVHGRHPSRFRHHKQRAISLIRGFVMLDRAPKPDGAWQFRWPSLTLSTVNRIHHLPGIRFAEAPEPAPPRPGQP